MTESMKNYYKHLYMAQPKEKIIESLLETLDELNLELALSLDEKRNIDVSQVQHTIISNLREENKGLKKTLFQILKINENLINKLEESETNE